MNLLTKQLEALSRIKPAHIGALQRIVDDLLRRAELERTRVLDEPTGKRRG